MTTYLLSLQNMFGFPLYFTANWQVIGTFALKALSTRLRSAKMHDVSKAKAFNLITFQVAKNVILVLA